MQKLADKQFGSLTVHADGGYSWDGKRLSKDYATVLDASALLPCNMYAAAYYAEDFMEAARIDPGIAEGAYSVESRKNCQRLARHVRKHWEWIYE